MTDNMVRAAKLYAQKFEWPVFAVSRNKMPMIPKDEGGSGYHDATKDQLVIDHTWKKYPGANVAVAVAQAKILVLDIDNKPEKGVDALETLGEIEKSFGKLPATPHVMTPGGGYHFYFKYDGTPFRETNVAFAGCGKGSDRPSGIDILCDGFVILPPSVGANGKQYQWESCHRIDELPLAPTPHWLINLAGERDGSDAPKSARTSDFWEKLFQHGIHEGYRNKALTTVAGHLLRRFTDEILTWHLMQSVNKTYCNPPISLDELSKLVDSVAEREEIRRKSAQEV